MPKQFRSHALLAGTVVLLALIITTAAGAKTLKVPSKYSTIQAAVNAASPGDTVQVSKKPASAPYTESVTVVTPRLTIAADSGVVLDGGGIAGVGDGFTVSADNVTIQGFTIQNFIQDPNNFAELPRNAIQFINVSAPTVTGVSATANDRGVLSNGAVNLVITGSSFTNNLEEGIRLEDGTNSTVVGNSIIGNANGAGFFYAVVVIGIDGVNLSLNNISNNGNGMSVETAAQGPNPPGFPAAKSANISLNNVSNNIGESITVEFSYLVNVTANSISGNLFGLAFLDGCLQCTATFNSVTGTSLPTFYNAGILVGSGSTAITVSHNDVENNLSDGIDVLDSTGNTITYNLSRHNTSAGSVDATDNTFDIGPNLNTWAHNSFGVTNPPGLG